MTRLRHLPAVRPHPGRVAADALLRPHAGEIPDLPGRPGRLRQMDTVRDAPGLEVGGVQDDRDVPPGGGQRGNTCVHDPAYSGLLLRRADGHAVGHAAYVVSANREAPGPAWRGWTSRSPAARRERPAGAGQAGTPPVGSRVEDTIGVAMAGLPPGRWYTPAAGPRDRGRGDASASSGGGPGERATPDDPVALAPDRAVADEQVIAVRTSGSDLHGHDQEDTLLRLREAAHRKTRVSRWWSQYPSRAPVTVVKYRLIAASSRSGARAGNRSPGWSKARPTAVGQRRRTWAASSRMAAAGSRWPTSRRVCFSPVAEQSWSAVGGGGGGGGEVGHDGS